MQLPAFITSAVNFFASAESKLDALAKSQTESAGLRAEISSLKEKVAATESSASAVVSELADAKTALAAATTAHAAEVAALKASISAEQKRANDVIAGQGLPLANIPDSAPAAHFATPSDGSLTEQCIAAKKKKNLK